MFLQADGRLGVFCIIAFNEEVKGLLCIVIGFCLPDFMQRLFGSWFYGFQQIIEDIYRFVNPATLATGLGTNLFECHLES